MRIRDSSDRDNLNELDNAAVAASEGGDETAFLKTFAALEASAHLALEQDLLALIGQFNRADDGSMVVPSEYLEIVITRH